MPTLQEWMVNTNNYFTSSDEQGSSAAASTSVCTDRQEQYKLNKVIEAVNVEAQVQILFK